MQETELVGFRLSPLQRHLWQMGAGDAVSPYRVQGVFAVRGELGFSAFQRALVELAEETELLRTTFNSLPGVLLPMQVVHDDLRPVAEWKDFSAREAAEFGAAVVQLAREEWVRPLALAQEIGARWVVASRTSDDHRLVLTMTALLGDRVSLGLLVASLMARLSGEVLASAGDDDDEAMQFGDVSEWQYELLQSEEMVPATKFWQGAVPSTATRSSLAGKQRPTEAWSPEWLSEPVSATEVALVERLAATGREPLEIVFLTLWQAYLGRRTGESQVGLGVLTEGRKYAELESLPGPLSVFLPMVSVEPSRSVAAALSTVSGHRKEALSWQEYYVPGGSSVPGSPSEGVAGSPPYLFAYTGPLPRGRAGGLDWELEEERFLSDRFELLLRIHATPRAFRLDLAFDASSFSRQRAADWLEGFRVFLSEAAASPSAALSSLEAVGSRERRNLVEEINATARTYPAAGLLLHELFEAQVDSTPGATALLWQQGSLSYRELEDRANRLAHYLRFLGVGPDSTVAVVLERSPQMVVALFAVLKAGGAYIPVDPSYPELRIAAMFEDASPAVVLTEERLAPTLPSTDGHVVFVDVEEEALSAYPADRLPSRAQSDHLAYLLFTSGSTGRPKGVMISHRAIVHHMLWMEGRFPLSAVDRVLQKTPFSFDASVWEFYAPLQAGGALVLARPGGHLDAGYLVEWMKSTAVTVLQVVPTQLRMLLAANDLESCSTLRRVLCGGEALPQELAESFHHRLGNRLGVELFNVYGPTEGTIHATAHQAESQGTTLTVPIGRPIANARVFVVDPAGGRLVPAGVPGELLVGGAGLARGYFRQPGLTAERFVPDAFSGESGGRLYRTADLVRMVEGGFLEYLGRLDFMVKLHGFRIELGEIEVALRSHPRVRDAVVVVHQPGAEDPRLAAYWEAADDRPEDPGLRAYVAQRLSPYMVPHYFMRLDSLPLSPNGKLDRKALPEPVAATGQEVFLPPATADEEVMAAIWSEVLGIETIGVENNFFALGADSIRAVRVVAQANERGFEMTLPDLFDHQTVRALVRALQGRKAGLEGHEAAGPLELLCAEDRSALPEAVEDAYPMTSMQLGMIYHMQLNPEEPSYHNITSFRLRLDFSEACFREAVERVVKEHPILRTSFDLDSFSEPLQLVHRQAQLPVIIEDLTALDGKAQEALLETLIRQQQTAPFDLSQAPQLRFFVHRLSEQELWFTVVENHAILDGWSLTSILREVLTYHGQLLAGEVPPSPGPLGTSFREYVQLEREARDSDECRDFWNRVTDGASLLKIPRWRSVAPQAAGGRAANLPVELTAEVREGLHRLSRVAAVPLKSLCLLAHLKVLSVISGEHDILTGFPCHGRPEAPDSDRIRGLFLNTVPFRLTLTPGQSWRDLAIRVFEVERAFLRFRRYPLSAIQKNRHDSPLFEVLFSFVHFHHLGPTLSSGALEILDDYKGWEANQYVLMCGFNQHPPDNELKLRLYYNIHELLEGQVQAIAGCFQRVLAAMTANPDESHDSLRSDDWLDDGERSGFLGENVLEGMDEEFDFF